MVSFSWGFILSPVSSGFGAGRAVSVHAPMVDGSREWLGSYSIDTDGAEYAMREWLEANDVADWEGSDDPVVVRIDGAGIVTSVFWDGVDEWAGARA